jgi:cytochrome c oxidase cbb3-type subunit III
MVWLFAQDKDKPESKEIKNPVGKDRSAIAAGREQYEAACAGCHGTTGKGGRGPRLAEVDRVRDMPDKQMFDVIKDGIKGTQMPAFPLPDAQIWQLVSFVRSLNASAIYQEVPGEATAGEALFFGSAKCSECHMIRGRGGPIGPDLSNIGATRSVEKIERAIKDPSALIEPGFTSVSAVTLDGRRISGVAKNNSNYSIQIMDNQGNFHFFLKKELKELTHYKKSLMPTPILSETEMQNLLAFLSRQSTEAPAEASKKFEHGKEREP